MRVPASFLCAAALLVCSALLAVVAHPHAHHGSSQSLQLHHRLSNPHLFLQPGRDADLRDFHPRSLLPFPSRPAQLTYYSYHIHCYFLASNANQTAEATALRDAFIAQFNVSECGGECSTECPNLCHWDLNMGPMGPHPVASWGMYVPLSAMPDTVAFISKNHGDLSVLVHPNSGYPIVDHSLNSFWIKQILPLDLSQLDPYDPPMEA